MKVPLRSKESDNCLYIYRNNTSLKVKFPILPTILSNIRTSGYSDKIKLFDIRSRKNIDIYKYQLPTMRDYNYKKNDIKNENGNIFTYNYIDQILIEKPEFFYNYPNDSKLNILYYDIETCSYGDGIFPNPNTHPIICIGLKSNNGWKKVLWWKEPDDSECIQEFFDILNTEKIDILVGYNNYSFDINYILERAIKNNIKFNKLFYPHKFKNSRVSYNTYMSKKFLHFDIYIEVQKDQLLTNLKDRKMKTLGNHFRKNTDREWIEADTTNTYKLFKDGLINPYIDSDLDLTEFLSNIYLTKLISMAEFIGCPLERLIDCYDSYIPTLLHGRNMYKQGLISFFENKQVYPFLQDDSKKFEAAVVNIKKTGFFSKVFKIDFTGMYPSSIVTWNLSPDTCWFNSYTKVNKCPDNYEYGLFLDNSDQNITKLYIYDDNYKMIFEIFIDKNNIGFLKKDMVDYFTLRKELKSRMKKDPDNYEIHNSTQNSVKIIQNSTFGYEGNNHAKLGDLSIAIAIVGICRWTTNNVLKWLDNTVIATDTDGIIVDGKNLLEENYQYYRKELLQNLSNSDILVPDNLIKYDDIINYSLKELIENKFNVECHMKMELEEFEQAYFYKAKNYCFREKHQGKIRLVKHGVAFKSQRHCNIHDISLDILLNAVLDQDKNIHKLINDIKNLSKYNIEDFVLKVRYSKDPNSYDSGTLQYNIASQYHNISGREVTQGDQIEYIKVKGTEKYKIASSVNRDEIDDKYYLEEINKVLEILGLYEIEQPNILDMFNI